MLLLDENISIKWKIFCPHSAKFSIVKSDSSTLLMCHWLEDSRTVRQLWLVSLISWQKDVA